AMAAAVGADVPFFLLGTAALAEGIGDLLSPMAWNVPFHAVIVRPAFGLPTREGYARLGRGIADRPARADLPSFRGLADVAASVRNDFENAWAPDFPELGRIKTELLDAGAHAAGLTGSGSAVFGLFESAAAARDACRRLPPEGAGGAKRGKFVARSIS
ncbi:MAG: 4-(cytidine 5'-diphospho)-2-C-methyl-D-erythritol kinase, partial [Verrucomicrobiota bacterium]